MERFCGKVDYRVTKLKTLEAVSKSMILEKAKEKAGKKSSFRSFKQETLARREVDLAWSEKMKEKFKEHAVFREALQKTGVNISPILLRLKDRENAENDRNLTVDR